MKRHVIFLLSLVGILGSCSSDDELKNEDTQEISFFIASSVATETFGLNALIQESAEMEQSVNGRLSICDYTDAGEYEVSSEPSATTAFSYAYDYNVSVNCTEQFPTSLKVAFGYSGNFEGPELKWNHEGNGDFDIVPSENTLVYNGTYDRSGGFEWKNYDRDGSSDVDLTLSDVVVSSEDKSIQSGSGTFEITVVRTQRTYSATGTIIFNGDDTATIKFDGNSITFNTINGKRS